MTLYNNKISKWQQPAAIISVVILLLLLIWVIVDIQNNNNGQTILTTNHSNSKISYLNHSVSLDWQRFKKQKQIIREVEFGEASAHDINYAFLHFNMKDAGKELLEKLYKMEHHPQYFIIKLYIDELKPYKTWEEWNQRVANHQPDYSVKD